jgi:hypothetical protein
MVSRELLLLFVLLGAAYLDVPPVALIVGHAPHGFSKILSDCFGGRGGAVCFKVITPRDFGPGNKNCFNKP